MSSTTNNNGRLCNQIFRNLAVSLVAEKHNLFIDYSNLRLIESLGIKLYVGSNSYKDTILLNDDNFFDILMGNRLISNINPNSNYFQTKDISNFIYNYLHSEEVKKSIMNFNPFATRYNNNNDLFIHIRLTDAAQFNPGLMYYIEAISKINFDNLYIASDDFNSQLIKNIINLNPNTKLLHYNEIQTIQFGSTCKNIVLSHGSFSAIIGYLGFFSKIYYPKYNAQKIWYGDMFSINGWTSST